MIDYVWLVPAFPLIGVLLNGLAGIRFPKTLTGIIGSAMILLSFLVSCLILAQVLQADPQARVFEILLYRWIPCGDLQVNIGFLVDAETGQALTIDTGSAAADPPATITGPDPLQAIWTTVAAKETVTLTFQAVVAGAPIGAVITNAVTSSAPTLGELVEAAAPIGPVLLGAHDDLRVGRELEAQACVGIGGRLAGRANRSLRFALRRRRRRRRVGVTRRRGLGVDRRQPGKGGEERGGDHSLVHRKNLAGRGRTRARTGAVVKTLA